VGTQRLGSLVAEAAEVLVDLLFPPTCGACRATLPALDLLCPRCEEVSTRVADPLCARCGLPGGEARCPDCLPLATAPASAGFDQARALYVYGGAIEEAVVRLKYASAPHLGIAAGARLGQALREGTLAPLGGGVDLVTAVPVGSARLRERGYDQAVLIGRRVARVLRRPFRPHLLARRTETPPQARLGRAQRRENVDGAFVARDGELRDRSVLLVDDVLTTGATADAAAAALKQAGAARVEVATLARAVLEVG